MTATEFKPGAIIPAQRSAIQRDDWETPRAIFTLQHGFHRFTVDVCATAANRVVPRYFDKEANGLAQSWRGERCWMHPPHGDVLPWVDKAKREAARGTLVVALLPARTHEAWWHEYVAPWARIQFLCGHMGWRLNGLPLDGQRKVEGPRGGFCVAEWHV